MTAPFLVTGGTGTLGRRVVPLLRQAGCDVRILSRTARPPRDGIEYVAADMDTGDGLDAALAGADKVLHLAGSQKRDGEKARNLVRAAERSGRPHIVYVSVVGCERIPVTSGIDRAMFGYFEQKRAAEVAIAESGLPYTTLRATQFHDLILMVAQAIAKLPVMPALSGVRFQPVDTGEVARRLADLTLGAPAGLVADLAGPTAYPMRDLLRIWLRATGKHRATLPIRAFGGAYRAVRSGANLPRDGADLGRITFEEFLAERQRATAG